jgi:hypothetical protein
MQQICFSLKCYPFYYEWLQGQNVREPAGALPRAAGVECSNSFTPNNKNKDLYYIFSRYRGGKAPWKCLPSHHPVAPGSSPGGTTIDFTKLCDYLSRNGRRVIVVVPSIVHISL